MEATSEEVCSTRFSRKSSASSTISSPASERCRQELDDYDVVFGVRPPSGTYHQQPGKHLSIDTRFSELSLENSSLIAESEREPSTLHRNNTSGSISRNQNKPSRVQVSKGNFYIASPFKQGPEKSAKRPTMVVDPSHDLKQRTIASVTKVKRQLDNVRRSQQFKLHHSQLQRGNLKPLGRPMTASGPAMNNCQGVVAGSRSYHGFTRRQKKTSLQDGKCQFSVFNSTKPDNPNQWARPESSVHNTSYASSVDAANDGSDGRFSEDEDEDSVDVENQACDLRGYTKKNDSSEKDIRYFSTGHGSNPKPSNTCKPYDDFFNRKGPQRDDDSDKEEGRWAQQTNQSVGYQEGGSRGNVTKKGQNKIGNGSTSGKQRSCRSNGDEENASSNYMYDLGAAKDLVDTLDISASTKPSQKIRNNVRRESDHFESTQLVKGTITKPLRSHSRVNTQKVIDVHVMDSDRQYATTERQHATMVEQHVITEEQHATTEEQHVTTEEQHVTTEEQHATMVGQHATAEGQHTTMLGQHASTQGQHTTIDENALHGISEDFPKGEYSVDLLESDALDSDRIPSEVIFRVLDELNLSTSAMKPPTPSGDRSRRRVQSAGHARRKPLVTKSETPLVKRDKRPASAKQVGRKKNQNTDCLDSSKINTASSTFGRVENLIKHTSEKIPGYFTEEYKKILEEKNTSSNQADKVKTDTASSRSLSLIAREFTETSNDFGHDEKRDQNMATNLSSDSKKQGFQNEKK